MTTWFTMDKLDVNFQHHVIVECKCPCRRRMKALWGEFETTVGLIRCFLCENNVVYGLHDFGRFRPLGGSLPIDKADAALIAGKNLRKIESPVFLETTIEPPMISTMVH